MTDDDALKLGRPIFATTREADLFRLANHYRGIVEGIVARAQRSRALFSDGLIRDLGLEMAQAPKPELLYFQPRPIAGAPRDGRDIVVLDTFHPDPLVARWQPGSGRGIAGWREKVPSGDPIQPYAWVPIDVEAAHGNEPR